MQPLFSCRFPCDALGVANAGAKEKGLDDLENHQGPRRGQSHDAETNGIPQGIVGQRQFLARLSFGLSLWLIKGIVMAKRTNLTPGTPAPISGQYRNRSTGLEVTATRGERLPPTQKSGQRYDLADRTKHKR